MSHYFTNDIVKDVPEEITIQFRDFTYKLNSNAGVFSKDKLDEGTRILLETVLDNESEPESTLDLGCGIGPIALILMEYWKHTTMTMIDVNQRAVTKALMLSLLLVPFLSFLLIVYQFYYYFIVS